MPIPDTLDGRLAPRSPRAPTNRLKQIACFIEKNDASLSSRAPFLCEANPSCAIAEWLVPFVPEPVAPASDNSIPIPTTDARHERNDISHRISARSLWQRVDTSTYPSCSLSGEARGGGFAATAASACDSAVGLRRGWVSLVAPSILLSSTSSPSGRLRMPQPQRSVLPALPQGSVAIASPPPCGVPPILEWLLWFSCKILFMRHRAFHCQYRTQ